MPNSPLPDASRHFADAFAVLAENAGPSADDNSLISVLTVAEGASRKLDKLVVDSIAALERRGTFLTRGYRSTAAALADLLGWDRGEARRRIAAAEQVGERVGLDGTPLPPRMAATAAAFSDGTASLRHVEAITRVLGSEPARRLSPEQWADVEAQMAALAGEYSPAQLLDWGTRLVDLLDADGPEPDDTPPDPVNELHLKRHRGQPGGTISGRFDDAAMFDAIATAIDAHARPRCAEDGERPTPARQAEALADICGFVLDHGDLPQSAGRRPR